MGESETILRHLNKVDPEVARDKNVFSYRGKIFREAGFISCEFSQPLLLQKTAAEAERLMYRRMESVTQGRQLPVPQDSATDVHDFLVDVTTSLKYMASAAARITNGSPVGFNILAVTDLNTISGSTAVIRVDEASAYRSSILEGLAAGQIPMERAKVLSCRVNNPQGGLTSAINIRKALVIAHRLVPASTREQVIRVDLIGLDGDAVFMESVAGLLHMIMPSQI